MGINVVDRGESCKLPLKRVRTEEERRGAVAPFMLHLGGYLRNLPRSGCTRARVRIFLFERGALGEWDGDKGVCIAEPG